MPSTNDDDLIEQLAETRAQVEALKRTLVEHAGALGAAQHFGDAAYGPLIASSLAVEVSDKGQIKVSVTDAAGRARTKFDSSTCRFAAFTTADLAAEISARWPQLARTGKDQIAEDAANDGNLTERMRRHRAAQLTAEAKLSDTERTAARLANPWARSTKNLTEQMRIQKRDPTFADELRRTATEAA